MQERQHENDDQMTLVDLSMSHSVKIIRSLMLLLGHATSRILGMMAVYAQA